MGVAEPPVVSDAPLDLAELEAIQAAVKAAAPPRTSVPLVTDAVPLPLFARERDAAAARPTLTELANRWARRLGRPLRAYLGEVELTATSAEEVEPSMIADELRTTWLGAATTPAGGHLVVAIGGDLIESGAARRCGADAEADAPSGRAPSPLAVRLFAPIGAAALGTLPEAWAELWPTELTTAPVSIDAALERLGRDPILSATIAVTGSARGQIRVLARPNVLTPASDDDATSRVAADAAAIAAALGAVPIEVRVELGTLRLRWAEVQALTVGSQLTLPVFVDDPLPIYCGDVLKAWGRPIVTRGVLSVEVAALARPGGGRP